MFHYNYSIILILFITATTRDYAYLDAIHSNFQIQIGGLQSNSRLVKESIYQLFTIYSKINFK